MLRYKTKAKRSKYGYKVTVTDTQGVRETIDVYIEFTDDADMGKGWRTYINYDGSWECHDEPEETKKAAIRTLQRYGVGSWHRTETPVCL